MTPVGGAPVPRADANSVRHGECNSGHRGGGPVRPTDLHAGQRGPRSERTSGTFRYAWLQVRRRNFGLPVLYTVIVTTTLASGQFFASAVMYWFFTFWHGRLRLRAGGPAPLAAGRALALVELHAPIAHEGSEVLVPVDRLRWGIGS